MFNDYMNCLWSDVTEDKILTLAKKAAALGAEGYCIDCGWYAPSDSLYGGLGDWKESPDRFPKLGLRGVLKEIQKLGLVAGVWTELELCSENAEAFSFPDEYFICEHGKRVGGGERYFFDFSNPDVRTYLFERVKALYDMGVRYIKNDFNAAIRWTTLSDVIAKNHRAAMAFYDGLKSAFPDLYLENCGSGAMRSDYGTLKHFCLQSTSDQELYYLNPPIAQGTLANILPEQAGIWAYPYPNLFDVRADARAMEEEAGAAKGRAADDIQSRQRHCGQSVPFGQDRLCRRGKRGAHRGRRALFQIPAPLQGARERSLSRRLCGYLRPRRIYRAGTYRL